jgi:membrane protein implicated in regulation of membrane protease activity
MPIVFAGILLGFIVAFFVLAFATGAIILLAPLVVIVIVAIQTYLKIRDRNSDENA